MEPSIKLIDFLIHVLDTHAHTLRRLAAFFGEDEFLQILESVEEPDGIPKMKMAELQKSETQPENQMDEIKWDTFFQKVPDSLKRTPSADIASCYARLEGAVREMKLPAFLEFHLWAYPFYRLMIESSYDLHSPLSKNRDQRMTDQLVNASVDHAQAWIKTLPIHPELSLQAERTALIPWLRFRTEFLKKMGRSPFVSL